MKTINYPIGSAARASRLKSPSGSQGCQVPGLGKLPLLLLGLLTFVLAGANVVHAYPNEVYLTSGTYRWKINNVEIGSTPSLATAISNCIWNSTGAGREIHILVGGSLAATIGVPPDVKVFGHGNTFTTTHTGIAVHARGTSNIQFRDMNLNAANNFYVFRITACNNVVLSGININGGGIGMRIDSSDSNHPWDFTVTNLMVTNCRFENLSSHGLETYGYDGATVDGIVARNNGECGVLLNATRNFTVGTVDAYRCCYGGGYAGFRLANGCATGTVNKVISVECGRGLFTVSDVRDVTIRDVYIRNCSGHAILLQDSNNVNVAAGTFNGDGLNHYTSVNCQINAIPLGLRRVNNVASGRVLDVSGAQNTDGALVKIWDWLNGANQKWDIVDVGGGRFSFRTSMAGGRGLDSSWNPVNGTATYIWSYLNNNPQKWQIQSVGNSRFRINSHINLNQCLDAVGTANGGSVITYSYWGGANQQWTIGLPQ